MTGMGELATQYLLTLPMKAFLKMLSLRPRVPTMSESGLYTVIIFWMDSCTLPMTNSTVMPISRRGSGPLTAPGLDDAGGT